MRLKIAISSGFKNTTLRQSQMISLYLKILGSFFLLLVVGGCATPPEYKIARQHDIATRISVVDELGNPVFGAEIWRVATPPPGKICCTRDKNRPPLTQSYLERVAKRYGDVAEFARQSRPGFLEALPDSILWTEFGYLDPSDEKGKSGEIIKYERGRTGLVSVKYAAMSYGYFPAFAQTVISEGERTVQLEIVLKRNLAITLPSAPYWTQYQEIRRKFESYQWKEGEAEPARATLIAAAENAANAGDNKIAAHIFSWIPYLPTATYFKDQTMSGYIREDETSDRNIGLLEKAAYLDPDNRYVRMKLLLLRPSSKRTERIKQLEALAAGGREDMWPQVFAVLEDQYYFSGQKKKSYQEFLWFKAFEPEYYRNQKDHYKRRLARHITLDEFRNDYLIGNDPNRPDEYGREPIYYAVTSGRVDFYDWLLINGVSSPPPGYWLTQAIYSRNPQMLRRILETPPQKIGGTGGSDFRSEKRSIDNLLKISLEDKESLEEMRRMLDEFPAHSAIKR